MRKYLIILAILLFACNAFAVPAIPNFKWDSGYGIETRHAYTSGNPNIFNVIDLTNGNDTPGDGYIGGVACKTGSFREAITYHNGTGDGDTVIVFSVSGTIPVDARLTVSKDNLWIVGQSAPSPGITLRNCSFTVRAQNVFVQHIRIRMDDCGTGDGSDCGVAYENRDALNLGSYETEDPKTKSIIFDHCSFSWGIDENVDMYNALYQTDPDLDITFNACIFAEPLNYSYHPETVNNGLRRGKNVIVGRGDNVALVECLFISADDRNPYMSYGDNSIVVSNCVHYNNRSYNINMSQNNPSNTGSRRGSIVNNYVLGGPSSNNGANYVMTFVQDSDGPRFADQSDTEFWIDGNRTNLGTQADEDDWSVVREETDEFADVDALEAVVKEDSATIVEWPSGYTANAADATMLSNVLANVGARPLDRDAIDARLISEVTSSGGSMKNAPPVISGVTDADGFIANDGDCTDTSGTCQTWDLGTDLNDNPYFLNNFPSFPHADNTDDGYTENTYTNIEEWASLLSSYIETGGQPSPTPDCADDANCIGNYFDGSSVVDDMLSGENDLASAQGESEWVNQSSSGGVHSVGNDSTAGYQCFTIDDAGGIDPSKMQVYPDNVGDISGKTLYVYKDTQTGGAGNDLNDPGGTLMGSIAGSNAWDFTGVDIPISGAIAQTELICFTMGEVDTNNYIQLRVNYSDSEAKIGDPQRFNLAGVWNNTNTSRDYKVILYEETGTPPAYASSVVTFDGTDDYLYAVVTDLHANFPGRTSKTSFGFVLRGITFASFPSDGNDETIIKLPNSYDCVVKTSGSDNLLEMRLYDGSDWHTYTHASDLAADTKYDILFSWDNATNTGVIDVATSSTSERLGTRIASTANDFNLNCPNSGNATIGYDGSGEFISASIETLFVFDDQLSATEFIDISSGIFDPPLPTCSGITLNGTTYTNEDIGSFITPGITTWTKAIKYSNVAWSFKINEVILPCWLYGPSGSSVSLLCGPLKTTMHGYIVLDDADFTVYGLLTDEVGNSVTDLTIPSITDPDYIDIYPTRATYGATGPSMESGGMVSVVAP